MRGDVIGSGGGEVAQPFSRQLHGVPAASRWTAGAQTPVVAHPEDAEAQRVLDVRYDTCRDRTRLSGDAGSPDPYTKCSLCRQVRLGLTTPLITLILI